MLKDKLKKILQFILNPRLLLCLGIAWIITNGWSYVFLAAGAYFGVEWMTIVGGGYVAFLWLPISPEKLATVAIAILLLRRLFPNDRKTLGVLKELRAKVRQAVKSRPRRRPKADGGGREPAEKAD